MLKNTTKKFQGFGVVSSCDLEAHGNKKTKRDTSLCRVLICKEDPYRNLSVVAIKETKEM